MIKLGNDYLFTIPRYQYQITLIHPLLEVYRCQMINDLLKQLSQEIQSISYKKLSQYFSQFIMSVITEKTFNQSIVRFDDGLFNRVEISDLQQFYDDVNYHLGKQIFVNDQLKIKESIDQIIISIQSFAQQIVDVPLDIYRFQNNRFILDSKILEKYHLRDTLKTLSNLVVNDAIVKKAQRKFSGPRDHFHDYLLCCVIRYETLGSGANQYAVDLSYKKQLKTQFGVNFECFASVLNHYFDYYCSLFYDLERYFGSYGSFMGLQIIKGFYMANPPYDDNLLNKMYLKVKSSLTSDQPVAFIMSIPKWSDFQLEQIIQEDHLFRDVQLKYEYFTNILTGKKVLIPPYLSYLFYNEHYSKTIDWSFQPEMKRMIGSTSCLFTIN